MFSCKFCKISNKTFLIKHFRPTRPTPKFRLTPARPYSTHAKILWTHAKISTHVACAIVFDPHQNFIDLPHPHQNLTHATHKPMHLHYPCHPRIHCHSHYLADSFETNIFVALGFRGIGKNHCATFDELFYEKGYNKYFSK